MADLGLILEKILIKNTKNMPHNKVTLLSIFINNGYVLGVY